MSTIVVRKSTYDNRQYKVIKLKNGFEALIVHDDRCVSNEIPRRESIQVERLAAVSMCIGIGSLHTPKDVCGLPHLIEHMYTEDGKKDDGFDAFICEHGGYTNAKTLAERCNFFFSISGKYLRGALERFADCFTKSSIGKTSLEAEVEAIDNEFFQEKNNLICILDFLKCYTLENTHPYHKIFSCGNKESLTRKKDDDFDLRQRAIEFRNTHYHGENMKLVVICGESLKEVEEWVTELFSDIPESTKKQKLLTSESPELLLELPNYESGSCIWAEKYCIVDRSAAETALLEMTWVLPSLQRLYKYKPEGYICYLLNQEGEGSLISLLKEKRWITRLKAEVSDNGIYRTSRNYILSIQIGLTDCDAPEVMVNDIISFVYEYLNLLRREPPEKWIVDEIQTIEMMKFDYGAEDQLKYAIRLSDNLLLYPPADVIFANHSYEWNENLITQVLSYLIPENMRIDLVKSFPDDYKPDDFVSEEMESDGNMEDDKPIEEEKEDAEHVEDDEPVEDEEPDDDDVDEGIDDYVSEEMENDDNVEDDKPIEEEKEDAEHVEDEEPVDDDVDDIFAENFRSLPWYERIYTVADFDEEAMKHWKENKNTLNSLKFPSRNEFVREHITGHCEGTSQKDNSTSPRCVVDEEWIKVWCKEDKVFCVPQATVYVRIHFYGARNEPKRYVLSELFLDLLNDKMSVLRFKAQMAGYKIKVKFVDGMLVVKIYGFSSPVLLDLLSKVLMGIVSFVPSDFDHFNLLKDQLKGRLCNNGGWIFHALLREHRYVYAEIKDHLNDTLLLKDVKEYIEEIKSQVYIETLCHGNVTEKTALDICDIIKKSFHEPAIYDGSKQVAERVTNLPLKANIAVSLPQLDENDSNSVALVYYQIGKLELESADLIASLYLFDVIVRDLFFREMRKTKHLCYTLSSSPTMIQNILGFSFKIESPKKDPYLLQEEIQKFLNTKLEESLLKLEEAKFRNHKTSVLEWMFRNFSSLKEESEYLWRDITVFRGQYLNITRKAAEKLERLEKKDVLEYYRTYFKSTSSKCRRVKVNTVGDEGEIKDQDEKKCRRIKEDSGFYES